MSKKFILENYNFRDVILDSYDILNEINMPSRLPKFPYDLAKKNTQLTYKEVSLKHIKEAPMYKTGGENITVFFY